MTEEECENIFKEVIKKNNGFVTSADLIKAGAAFATDKIAQCGHFDCDVCETHMKQFFSAN